MAVTLTGNCRGWSVCICTLNKSSFINPVNNLRKHVKFTFFPSVQWVMCVIIQPLIICTIDPISASHEQATANIISQSQNKQINANNDSIKTRNLHVFIGNKQLKTGIQTKTKIEIQIYQSVSSRFFWVPWETKLLLFEEYSTKSTHWISNIQYFIHSGNWPE